MKSLFKITLSSLSVIIVVVGVLWMRSLASWRPQKVAQLGKYDNFIFLSSDERTALVFSLGKHKPLDLFYKRDTATNKITRWTQGQSIFHGIPAFSQSSPDLAASIEIKGNEGALRIHEVPTGHLKRTFHWPAQKRPTTILLSPNGDTAAIVQGHDLFRWNIANGELTRTRLSTQPGSEFLTYALSPDGTTIIGWGRGQGEIWIAASGKSLCHWTNIANKHLLCFSPDARIAVHRSQTYDFVDTSTGKVNWRTDSNIDPSAMCGDEIVFPRKDDCEVRGIFTGKTKRRLVGPRQSEGRVVRVTPDYIYTLNSRNQILRWRAR